MTPSQTPFQTPFQTPSSSTSLPSASQIALACLVLKSKPLESSVEDHISQLRACIRTGARASTGHHHLDSATFWKEAYSRSEAAQTALLDRQHDLEYEVEDLRNRKGDALAQTGIKRKPGFAAADGPLKRANTSNNQKASTKSSSSQSLTDYPSVAAVEDVHLSTQIPHISNLNAAFFALRQQLAARDLDAKALDIKVRRVCIKVDALISESLKQCSSQTARTKQATESARKACLILITLPSVFGGCFPSLLQAVEKLSRDSSQGKDAVAAIVLLFSNILGHLHQVAGAKTDVAERSTSATRVRRTKTQPLLVSNCHDICSSLSKIAIAFFDAVTNSKRLPPQERILEGLTCVFLDHLGSSLSLLVFADPITDTATTTTSTRAKNARAIQPGLLPPQGLIDTSRINQHAAIQTTQQEAPHLVHILRHLLLCTDRQQKNKTPTTATPTIGHDMPNPSTSNTDTDKAYLVTTKTREKLQHTLLRGIFGDEDPAFIGSSLCCPDLQSAMDMDKDMNDNDGDDDGVAPDLAAAEQGYERRRTKGWLVGQVWKLLGWDVLGGKGVAAIQ